MGSAWALQGYFVLYTMLLNGAVRRSMHINKAYTLCTAIHSASVVHSVFPVGPSTNITWFMIKITVLSSGGCRRCIAACSYIVLPCYVLYLQGRCRAGSAVCRWYGLLCTTYRGKGEE